jgi:hypothetical protein
LFKFLRLLLEEVDKLVRLLRHPSRIRMSGHADDVDAAGTDVHHDKHLDLDQSQTTPYLLAEDVAGPQRRCVPVNEVRPRPRSAFRPWLVTRRVSRIVAQKLIQGVTGGG